MDTNKIKFENQITESGRDAIWQYMLDHSKLQKNGYWGIMFYVKDEEDLWRRVSSRYYGDFQRYDKLEKESKMNKFWDELRILRKMSDRHSKIAKEIDRGNNIVRKIILFTYRKTRIYLFRK